MTIISLGMTVDEAESLEAFIRSHERDEVPDDVLGRIARELRETKKDE